MKKTRMTTKALSMLLTVIMLFTTISVGIIMPEAEIEADAAELTTGATYTISSSATAVSQINSAIAAANTAGANVITTIKLGAMIQLTGSLASFTKITGYVLFDFNGNSLLMNYTASGNYSSSQTGIQLPSANQGSYFNGTDCFTNGMFMIDTGGTMKIINSKPGNISNMQVYTELADTRQQSDLKHQTSSSLIYNEGTLIIGDTDTTKNDFKLYAHSLCRNTNAENPNLYGEKSATANCYTVTLNSSSAILKMYGGKVEATGAARARRGTYADILCYALNVNNCYSAEIYGGEINIPKCPNEQNNGIFQESSKACEGGTSRITAIRCNSPYLYIFDVNSSVQSKTGTDSSKDNHQYTSNIWSTSDANAANVFGGYFYCWVEEGNNSSTAHNHGYIARGPFKIPSNGTLIPSAVSGSDHGYLDPDRGDKLSTSYAGYTVFITDNGVVRDASNKIVATNIDAENGIDIFSYNTFRQYLADHATALNVYAGNEIMTANGDANKQVGSTNYIKTGYTHDNWAGKTHPGAAYDINYKYPAAAGFTDKNGGSLFLAPLWTENTYTIHIDYNDSDGKIKVSDTSSCPTSYKITSTFGFGTPVRPGYEFKSWTVTKYEYPSTDTKKPWTLSTYTVGFEGFNTFTFNGRNGDVWLKANWELIGYTATFDLDGGNQYGNTADLTEGYNVEGSFNFPEDIEKDYYDFTGYYKVTQGDGSWRQNDTLYKAGDMSPEASYGSPIFTAQYTPTVYTVTYDSALGSSVDDEDVKKYTYESTHTLPAVTRVGYVFAGWKPLTSVDGSWSASTTYPAGFSFKGMHGNVTLVAQWESAVYTLDLKLADGENIDGATSYNYAYANSLNIKNPTKTGYTFKGWVVDVATGDGNTWGQYEKPFTENIGNGYVTIPANNVGNVTLKPIWEADKYDITFDPNGGQGCAPLEDYTIEDTIILPVTTKKGYVFTGWSVAENDGNWIKENYSGTLDVGMYGNVTLRANWEKAKYVVTLDAAGGSVSTPTVAYDFESQPDLPVPSKTGYSFTGWKVTKPDAGASWTIDAVYTDKLPAGEYGNVTLEAQWEHTQYNIHFVSNGTTPSDMSYYIDSEPFRVPASSYPGYNFLYWYVTTPAGNWEQNKEIYTTTDIEGKYGNVTFSARFEPVTYTITYRDIDGSEKTVEYDMATPVTLDTYEKAGYNFGGWRVEELTDGVGWTGTYQPGGYTAGERYGNVVLVPVLTPIGYTITFIPDGGTPFANLDYTIESADTLPVPVKSNYDFAGWKVTAGSGNWSEAEAPVAGGTAVTGRYGDVTLTAQWTPKKYTVKFVNDDGSLLQSSDVAFGTLPVYEGATPTKAATAQYTYTFTGWTPTISVVTGEATYTAQYSKTVNSYTVTWKYETDESGPKTLVASYNYGEHPVFNNGINPVKKSSDENDHVWRFLGWEDDYGNYLDASAVVTENVTYTAQFKKVVAPRTVVWMINGSGQVTKWEVGETPSYVGTPRKPDSNGMKYTFSHWTPDIEVVERDTDYEYTAQFTESPQTYTASFDADGGKFSGSAEVTYNKVDGLDLPVPVKDGYRFLGWRVTSNAGTWYDTGLLTHTNYSGSWGDVSLKAEYAAGEYTIKVEDDGVTTGEYIYTVESTDTLPAITKDGYVLTGWMIVSGEGNWVPGDTVSADKALLGMYGNVTVMPLWTAKLYKITWISGDITQVSEFRYGDLVVAYTPISQPGYTAAWDNEVPTIMPAVDDLVFTAVYTPIEYYLRFNVAGGTPVENFYYDITSTGTLPTPTREGATFDGWKVSAGSGSWVKNKVYPEGTALAGNYGSVTLTAVWKLDLYTVTWEAGDVTRISKWYHGAVPSYDGVPYKSSDDLYSYEFIGWDKEIVTVTEDVTYKALFRETARKYTVQWNVDGHIVEEVQLFYNTPLEDPTKRQDNPIPVPTRPSTAEFDFTFAGWTPEISPVTGDITYYAVFEPFTKLLGLRIDKTAVFLNVGEEAVVSAILSPSTASARDVVWISSDESIATVSASGKITAVGAGDVLIRVESKDGAFKSYCLVSVAPIVTQYVVISANGVSTTRLPGEAIQLTATVQPGNATNKTIVWSSSNTAVAMVDSNGLVVFGESIGTAVITAVADGYAVGTIEVATTTKTSEIDDSVKTYTVMFLASSSYYVIEGNTYESINIIYPEGSTVEFLLTEPHFVTLNGVQFDRDTDGVFRIKDLDNNYSVIATERADMGMEDDSASDTGTKLSFFDRIKEFFRKIMDFFRNLFG